MIQESSHIVIKTIGTARETDIKINVTERETQKYTQRCPADFGQMCKSNSMEDEFFNKWLPLEHLEMHRQRDKGKKKFTPYIKINSK